MRLNIKRLSTAEFTKCTDTRIYFHWPGSLVEIEFETDKSLHLGTQQKWWIPRVPPGRTADRRNSIRVRLEATGETYYIYDRGWGDKVEPFSRLSTLSPEDPGTPIPITEGADLDSLEIVLSYIGRRSPDVAFGLEPYVAPALTSIA